MAIERVENEIQRFLSSKEPEVICISGHWGVGKTFAWNKYLKDANTNDKIALKRYSYVSLFGVNSLDELRYAIFENSVKTSDIGAPPSLKTLESNLFGTISSLSSKAARKSAGVAQQTPFLKNYLGGLAPVWFASVTANVICIDDFERRGKNLAVRDVLGLINNLKELKKCKVCLILNDEALEEGEGEFQKYLEKVVDATLKFQPSPEDCVRIAIASQSSDSSKFLAECCIKLGISNIRVIKKIERSVRQIEPVVAEFDKQVLKQAVHSLTLLGWSVCEPTKAPSLNYLRKKSEIDFLSINQKTPVPDNEAAWNALLGIYGFGSMDEFDLALLEGIRNGYFDSTSIKEFGAKLDTKIKAGNLDASFNAAWEKFHHSFDDNQDEVLDAMYDSFLKGVHYITPMNMNSTVVLFKELGRETQAAEMLKRYIEVRSTETQLFNLRSNPFADRVSDPDVIKAFQNKFATFKLKTSPTEILLRIADTHSWNPEDITTLSSLAVDEYSKMFKATNGPELRKLIGASLMFDSIMGGHPEYQEVAKRAKEALKRIGGESPINARRVKTYGVEVDSAKAQG